MNDPSSLRRLCPISNRPLPHLIRPRREKAAKIKHLPHGRNDLGQRGFCAELFTFLFRFCLSLETCEALLEGDRERQYRVAWCVLFHPFGDLGKMLILLSDVVFLAKVDEVDNRFSAEEEERINDFDLVDHSN